MSHAEETFTSRSLSFFPSLTKLMKMISDDLFGLYDERKFLMLLLIEKGLYHV